MLCPRCCRPCGNHGHKSRKNRFLLFLNAGHPHLLVLCLECVIKEFSECLVHIMYCIEVCSALLGPYDCFCFLFFLCPGLEFIYMYEIWFWFFAQLWEVNFGVKWWFGGPKNHSLQGSIHYLVLRIVTEGERWWIDLREWVGNWGLFICFQECAQTISKTYK